MKGHRRRTRWACAVRDLKRKARHAGKPLKVYARELARVHGPERSWIHRTAEFWIANKPGKPGQVPA